MRLALDTNRYTDLCRGVEDTVRLVSTAEAVFLPFAVVAELRAGFAFGNRSAENERVLRRFLLKEGVAVLYADDQTTHHCAAAYRQLRVQGTPIPTNDLWMLVFTLATVASAYDRGAGGTNNRLFVCNVYCITLVLTLGVHLTATLWDRRSRWTVPALYLWGLLATVLVVVGFWLNGDLVIFGLGIAVALYVALTGWLWFESVRWAALGSRLGIQDPVAGLVRTARCLPVVTVLWSAPVMLIAVFYVLTDPDRGVRIAAGMMPFALAAAMRWLAQKERRGLFEHLTLADSVVYGSPSGLFLDVDSSSIRQGGSGTHCVDR